MQEALELIQAGGTLAFALLALGALITERVVPRARLDEMRADKKEALELARSAIASTERLADAVEARNAAEGRARR